MLTDPIWCICVIKYSKPDYVRADRREQGVNRRGSVIGSWMKAVVSSKFNEGYDRILGIEFRLFHPTISFFLVKIGSQMFDAGDGLAQ